MLASIEEAVNRRWGQHEELLATLVEVNHALLVAFLEVHSSEQGRRRIPKPLHIPRPGEPTKPKAVSPAALARALTGEK